MLVILLAPRPRADASDADTALVHVLSHDGLAVAQTGRCAPALMPKADSVVAVVPVGDIAWHRPVLPKAPPSRLRQALVGVFREVVLLVPARRMGPQLLLGKGAHRVADHFLVGTEKHDVCPGLWMRRLCGAQVHRG